MFERAKTCQRLSIDNQQFKDEGEYVTLEVF